MKRSLAVILVAVAACSALIQWSSCGSSSSTPTPPEPTAPTVTLTGIALATGTSTTIATSGTTGISGATTAPLTMTFSTAMDDATVNAGTTFSCPDGSTLTPTVTSSDNTIYTITPASALPGITNCILSLANTIQDSSGNALTATAFNYQTGCRTDDNFSTDTLTAGCWTQTNPTDASTYSVSIANNLLNMSVSVAPIELTELLSEYKIFGDSDLIATVSIPTFSGIVGAEDSCGILLYNPTAADSMVGMGIGSVIFFGSPDEGKLTAHVMTIEDSGIDDQVISAAAGTSSAALSGTLYFRISQLGSSTTVSYRIGSTGDFTTMGTVSQTFGTTKHLGLISISDGTDDTICKFATFTVTDADGNPLSATGQY